MKKLILSIAICMFAGNMMAQSTDKAAAKAAAAALKAAQKEAERVQKARMKAQKKAAKKKKKAQPAPTNRSGHSATYMKKHKDD